ncbi:MAG: HAMP domain-containing histidine kinase [Armatimonadetes bacterium]|nr:HAMP domain-containing histidine kinase [Armatimonadota bacterium]
MKRIDGLGAEALRFAEAELTERLHWFIRMRWVAAAGVLVGTLIGRWVILVPIQTEGLLAVALGIAGLNLLFTAWDRRLSARGRASIAIAQARPFANVQIAADLVCLGILLHFSGGVENPLCFLFAFHMIIASILLSPEMAHLQAVLAIVILAAMVGLEQYGLIRHIHLGLFMGPEFYQSAAAWLMVFTLGSTLFLLVYMTTSITGRLREREAEAARLAHEVAEKAGALEAAYDELLATQKLQVTYMRKTSHELRAPLAAIGSTLDVIAEGVVGELQPKQKELLDRARERVRGLMRLVTDLLTLLKSRAAPPKERFEAVNLDHVVRKVVDLLAERADEAKVSVNTHLPPGLPPVWGDDELLDQIATNLISNAIKYTPAGGSVSITSEADEAHTSLRVADTGIGIAAEDLPRVFDEFYRTKGGRDFTSRGTGLGLAIVKSIADAHEAVIAVESEVGKGTTFTIRFPRADGRPSEPAATPEV